MPDATPGDVEAARRVRAVRGRSFAVGLPPETLEGIQRGSLHTRYKGLRFVKNPFDVVLYLQLLDRLRPGAVVEVGTAEGGSALWFRDQMRALDIEPVVLSYDLEPPDLDLEGVRFHRADGADLGAVVAPGTWSSLPGPRVFVEDSAHTHEVTSACLAVFAREARSGDWVVVEDGVVADLPEPRYRTFDDGPNRAVAEFLDGPLGNDFEIVEEFCDFYGHNVTYCPNAWLRRR